MVTTTTPLLLLLAPWGSLHPPLALALGHIGEGGGPAIVAQTAPGTAAHAPQAAEAWVGGGAGVRLVEHVAMLK